MWWSSFLLLSLSAWFGTQDGARLSRQALFMKLISPGMTKEAVEKLFGLADDYYLDADGNAAVKDSWYLRASYFRYNLDVAYTRGRNIVLTLCPR